MFSKYAICRLRVVWLTVKQKVEKQTTRILKLLLNTDNVNDKNDTKLHLRNVNIADIMFISAERHKQAQ